MSSTQVEKSVELVCFSGKGSQPPWLGALNDIVNECTSIRTGKFQDLIINQGGIQNRISLQVKQKFKHEVLPNLMTISCMNTPLTGRIEGDLAEGVLQSATLYFQCEAGHEIKTSF